MQFTANSTQMRETASEVQTKEQEYMRIVNQISDEVNHLGQLWNSPAYDQFKQMFESKVPSLNRGDELMKEFKQKLDSAADSFDQAQNAIRNSFN